MITPRLASLTRPRPRRLTLLGLFAVAASQVPSPAAFAADWTLDPAHSTLGFSGTQTGTPFAGHFTHYETTIRFDPDHPETSSLTVVVQLASATTGDAQRDDALPTKDWFDVAAFPAATFSADRIRKIGPDQYEADGTLNLRGISKPVTLPFTLGIQGRTAHARGHATLARTVFGIGQGPWSTGQWVALDVGVDVDITANRTD